MAFLLGVLAELATVIAAAVLVTLGTLGQDGTLRRAGVLLFSLGLFQASLLAPGPALAYLLSSVAGLVYLAAAPTFYHDFLELRLGPRLRWIYAALWGAFLVLTLQGWTPSSRPSVLPAILTVFFAFVVWGLVLMGWRARSPRPMAKLTQRFLGRFALVGAVALPLLVLDIVGTSFRWFDFPLLDNLALPVFLLILDVLILLEARRWTSLPAQDLSPPESSVEGLTTRETEIARRILEGASAKEIGAALSLSPKTVENHTYRIYQKLGVKSRLQFYHRYRSSAPMFEEPLASSAPKGS